MTQAMLDRFLLTCTKMCLDKMVISTANLLNHLAYETQKQKLPKHDIATQMYFKRQRMGKTILKIRIARFRFHFLKMQGQYCNKHKRICTMDWEETKRWITTFLRLCQAYNNQLRGTPYTVFLKNIIK